MSYEAFLEDVLAKAHAFFATLDEKSHIKHVSHLDADGISSAAIMIGVLTNKDVAFTTRVLPTLDDARIADVVGTQFTHYVFTDLGSGQLSLLAKHLADKHVLILDHHEIEDIQMPSTWIHVNPRLFGVDGSSEIAGAGVTYLFAKSVDKKFVCASHLALLGATGDAQHKQQGFSGANVTLLADAVSANKIQRARTLNVYGVSTSSIPYLLEYSKEIAIPGVNNVRGAGTTFIQNIGIDAEIGGKQTKLSDLSTVEFNRLLSAIITARNRNEDPEDLLGEILYVLDEPEGYLTRNLKEFSTLLNACGRMKKFGVGIGACLGDASFRELSTVVHKAYKQKIAESLRWFRETKPEYDDNVMIINGGTSIPATMIGTLASIVSRQAEYPAGMHIVSFARNDDGTTKVSVRVCGDETGAHDLNTFIRAVCGDFDAQAGGHSFAAGAVIPTAVEDEFLERVRNYFNGATSSVRDDVAKQSAKQELKTVASDVL